MSLAFDDELGALAKGRGVNKGAIFQALLEALREAGCDHGGGLDNDKDDKRLAGMGLEFGCSISQWALLAHRAEVMRRLIRIKLQDENDLRTARQGLLLCSAFFEDLAALTLLTCSGYPGAIAL